MYCECNATYHSYYPCNILKRVNKEKTILSFVPHILLIKMNHFTGLCQNLRLANVDVKDLSEMICPVFCC